MGACFLLTGPGCEPQTDPPERHGLSLPTASAGSYGSWLMVTFFKMQQQLPNGVGTSQVSLAAANGQLQIAASSGVCPFTENEAQGGKSVVT